MIVIPENHCVFASSNEMNEICKPLFDNTAISFFQFCRIYSDGSRVILNTHAERTKVILQSEYSEFGKFQDTIKNNFCTLWKQVPSFLSNTKCKSLLLNQLSISKNIFHVDHGFSIFQLFTEDFVEYYDFATHPDNDFIYDFYLQNTDLLQKFIFYFKEKGFSLIQKAINHKILFNNLTNEKNDKEYLELEGNSNNFNRDILLGSIESRRYYYNEQDQYFTKQELSCITLLAKGQSIKEIAKTNNLSPRTVESYLNSAKSRNNIKNNQSLIKIYWQSRLTKI